MIRIVQTGLLAVVLLTGLPVVGQPRPRGLARPGGRLTRTPLRPYAAMEHLNAMTPEERERFLSRMPPDRRQHLEERLRAFQNLSPEARERLRRESAEFEQLTPEKQQAIRDLFRQMNELPEDRRVAVRRELNHLRNMPPERRTNRMASDRFRNDFSDSERDLMDSLVKALPPPPPRDAPTPSAPPPNTQLVQ